MPGRLRSSALSFFALALVLPAYTNSLQEKVLLRFAPEPGQTARYKVANSMSFEAMGETFKLEDTSTVTFEVLKVENGNATIKATFEPGTSTLNGEEIPAEEAGSEKEVRTSVMDASGMVKSVKIEPEPEAEQAEMNGRMGLATTVVFDDKAVGAGDSWTKTFATNAQMHSRAAKSTYTLEAFEEVDGVPCARIKQIFDETEGDGKLHAESTHWVELKSGDAIKVDYEVKNLEIDFGFGDKTKVEVKGKVERTSGGLVKSDTNKDPSEEVEEGDVDKKIKEFVKISGWAPLYRQDKDGKTTIYLELTKDLLSKPMMLECTAGSGLADGRVTAGDPISDLVFEFRRLPNDRIVMYVPNTYYRADNDSPIARAVQRSYPDAIVESFDIEAEQDGRMLIDLSNFFRGDISRLNELLAGGGGAAALFGGGGGSYSLDRENSYYSSVKNFPENLFVQAVLNFVGRGGGAGLSVPTTADDRSVVIKLNYNMFPLPVDNGYQPRLFDPRVGFFTSDYRDYTHSSALDQKVMLINRWNLVKKDPSAPISDPVEPIVFYIDNSVPLEYRGAVKEAIEGWNKAFLAAGFSNAVVAKQMPDDAEFDHADMRFNVVRWVTSPSDAYAIALFRTNPITGQILNGSVTVDANIVRAFADEYSQFVRPEAWQSKLMKRLQAMKQAGPNALPDCTLLEDGGLNAATAFVAAGIVPGISRDEYVNQFVRWVVGHEMGHMMGLRHNFVASTLFDLDELGQADKVEADGTSASVMDYVAFNPAALTNSATRFYGNTVGRYDIFAIEYGYKPFPRKDMWEERFDLMQLAEKGTERGLAWRGDEFADSIDPYITRFDLGKDPLSYWLKMAEVSRGLIMDLGKNSPKPGESYYSFTRDFNVLLGEYTRSASELTRFIGGVRRSGSFKGDPNGQPPLVNIDGATQRKALAGLTRVAFDAKAFDFPKSYYQYMMPNPKGEFIDQMIGGLDDYPMRDQFSSIQEMVLDSLFDASTLNRVVNQEFEAQPGESPLRLVDLFKTISTAVWSEVKSGSSVSPLRRDLQRAYAGHLVAIVLEQQPAPQEAKALARVELINLSKNLKAASAKSTDDATKLHWADLATQIDHALQARPTVGSGSSAAPMSLADLLGGYKSGGN